MVTQFVKGAKLKSEKNKKKNKNIKFKSEMQKDCFNVIFVLLLSLN